MPPAGAPLFTLSRAIQLAPAPYSRATAVCTDDPPRPHCALRQLHALTKNPRHGRFPKKLHAAFFSTFDQESVQKRPPDSHSVSFGEIRSHFVFSLNKPNSAKTIACTGRNLYPQFPKRVLRPRHHSFAARLINWRRCAIRQHDRKPFSSRGDCGSQPGRSAANDKNIGRVLCEHFFHLS